MRAIMGRALRLVAWTFAVVAALFLSALVHVRMPIVRPLLAAWTGHLVTGEIRGALRIGRLDAVSFHRVDARHLELFDVAGKRIVSANGLVLTPDLRALWERGELRFTSARLRGGTARLIDAGAGLPTLLQTFDARVPPTGPRTGEPLHAVVEGIAIDELALVGDLLGVKGFRAEGLRARGRMEIGREVRVRIDEATATLVRPFGFPARIEKLRGTISTVDTESVALEVDASRGDERAHVRVRYAAPKPGAEQELDLEVRGQNLTPETLRGLGFAWIGPLKAPLTGTFRMRGPTDRLALEGDFTTPAGAARVSGELRDGNVRVTITSDALSLGEALTDAPEVTVRGALTIETTQGAPHPRLHADVAPLVHRTIALPGFTVDAVLEDDGLRVERVYAQRKGADIEGSGRVTKAGAIEMRVKARVADIAQDPQVSLLLPGARGRLNADLLIRVPESGRGVMRFSGQMALDNVRYGMLSARRLVLSGRMGGDPDLPSLDLTVSGRAVALGDFPLGDASLRMAGATGRYRASGQFERGGQRAFHLDAEITADRKGFVVNADPIELVLAERSWRGALRELRVVHGESVSLGLLRLASRSQRLEAHGTVRVNGQDELEAQLQDFDLSAVSALVGPKFPLHQGRTDTHLLVTGDVARPNVLLEGALREGTLDDLAGVNALYAVNYEDGELEFDFEADLGERGVVRAGGTGYLALAIADVREAILRGTYKLDVSTEDFDLAVLPTLRDAGVSGRLGGNFHVSGSARTPDLSGSFVAAPLTLPGWAPFAFRGEANFGGNVLDGHVTVLDDRGALAVVAGDAHIDVAAVIDDPSRLRSAFSAGPWRLRAQTAMRPLAELPEPLARPWPIRLGLDAQLERSDGATSGLVRYSGRWTDPLRDTDCAASATPNGQGFVKFTANGIEASLSVFAGAERFADLSVTFGATLDRWLAQGDAIDPGEVHAVARVNVPHIERLPYACEQGKGSLAAEVRLDGAPGAAPVIAADVEATFTPQPIQVGGGRPIRVRSCDRDPVRAHFTAASTGSDLTLSGNMHGCFGGATTLRGVLPIRWEGTPLPMWDEQGRVEGMVTFDGAQLRPLLRRTPGLHGGEAVARGKVSVSGTPSAPRFDGELGLSGGRIYLVSPGQELESLDAHVTLRGTWAKIDRFVARSGDGRLEASGGIGFDAWVPRRAQLAMRAIELGVQREGLELANLTGSAAIESDFTAEKARSAVRIHELTVRLPDQVERTLQALDPHPDVSVVTDVEPEVVTPYPVEFVVDARRTVRVVRDDLRAEIAAELAVVYAEPEFRIGGYIQLLRGDFDVLGKRFSIVQGSLRFDGTTDIDPEVSLVATHQPEIAGSAPVSVTVNGTLLHPEITFATDACPGRGGAVAYLVSGQCSADDPELAAETTAAEDTYKAGVMGAVGAVGTSLFPRLGNVALAAESAGEGWRTRVSAGVAADEALPKWMRPFVQRVYVQGAVVTPSGEAEQATLSSADATGATGTDTTESPAPSVIESWAPEVLLQLYFPYHLVGSAKYSPNISWGVDITWEP
jgi:hypothetical protein